MYRMLCTGYIWRRCGQAEGWPGPGPQEGAEEGQEPAQAVRGQDQEHGGGAQEPGQHSPVTEGHTNRNWRAIIMHGRHTDKRLDERTYRRGVIRGGRV